MGATEALKEKAGLVKKPMTIIQLLESLKPQVALALPKHLQPERMIRIALTSLRTNPKLMECDPQSIMASIMLASQLGLEPGVMGQCYLVPYKGTCTLIPGWQGLLDLVNRAGKATAWTGAVYQGDEFEWQLGDNPKLTHRPCGDEEKLTHVYAVARAFNSPYPILEVWPIAKVLRHRDKFNKVGERHYSYANMEMYARKVALLQALKYIPRSVELATAYNIDAAAEVGQQKMQINDVKEIIEGSLTFEPQQEQLEPEKKGPVSVSAPTTEQHESAISLTDFSHLMRLAKDHSVIEDDVLRYAQEAYDVLTIKDLTKAQFGEVEKWVASPK